MGLTAVSLLAFVVTAVVYVAIVVFIWRWWKKFRTRLSDPELVASGDATRYALASAVIEGAGFRRRVIDLAEHRYRAKGPELGMDFPLLLAACRRFEREDRLYNWLIFVPMLFTIPFLWANIDPWTAFSLFPTALISYGLAPLCLTVVIIMIKAMRDMRRLTPFIRENYDYAKVRAEFLGPGAPPSTVNDNVICYGTQQPFIGIGTTVGAWQVVAELDRKVLSGTEKTDAAFPPNGRNGNIRTVNPSELLRSIDESVKRLGIQNLEFRFPLFVSGTEVAQIPQLLPDKFAMPRKHADPDTLGYYWYYTDSRARSYRWYMITDWNGEIVISYLLRICQRGQSLFVESARIVLPPVGEKYRKVDNLLKGGFFAVVGTLLTAVVKAPLTILYAIFGAFHHVMELIGIARRADSGERRVIAKSPSYNYGARETIREYIASKNYHAYFQRMDATQYYAAIDRRVLNALVDSLADAGLDVTSIVNQAMNIINNTTNINATSGTVVMGNVGAGAAVGNSAMSGMQQAAQQMTGGTGR